jgi:hypothetical protein
VSDGGDSYWCAVYIIETGEFVKFKGRHFDTHVWFCGSSSAGPFVLSLHSPGIGELDAPEA